MVPHVCSVYKALDLVPNTSKIYCKNLKFQAIGFLGVGVREIYTYLYLLINVVLCAVYTYV